MHCSKPNLNLQKGPLTQLVLAWTQITTLMVRNNELLYCQLFRNQQFKETVPRNDLNEVYIKERKLRTESPAFSLLTSFMPRYHRSSKKSYDSYAKISYADRKLNIASPMYRNHKFIKRVFFSPLFVFECSFFKFYLLLLAMEVTAICISHSEIVIY